MEKLTASIVATFFSRAWGALLLLALVPLYVRFLGVEAYGVVGVFVTVQAFISLLDLGFAPALTRELARLSVGTNTPAAMRDLLRTMEVLYWGVAGLIALALFLVAPALATHWLRPEKLTSAEVAQAIAMGGAALAVQWPSNLYSAGLSGIQRQVPLAWIVGITSTARALATVLALWLFAPTLQVFFMAQVCVNLLQTSTIAGVLWSYMPRAEAYASFRVDIMRRIVPFATGMMGISLTSVVLTQLDKAILSKTLPLEAFGYYAVASTFATGLYVIVSPIFAVLYPRFSRLVAEGDSFAVARLYDTGCQLMSALVLPATALIALFSPEILRLWTGDLAVVENSHVLLSLLIVGNALNGLVNVPYALQLAHGWTNLAFYSNILAILICAPLTYLLSVRFGAVGGALVWVALTFGYLVTNVPLAHSKLLRGSLRRWYLVDVGGPALASLLVIGAVRFLAPAPPTGVAFGLFVILVGGVGCLAAAFAAPEIRALIFRRLQSYRLSA